MRKVKIRGLVITNQYGTLKDGDILNASDEFAKHLVEDCNCADYVIEKEPLKAETKEAKKEVAKTTKSEDK